MGKACDGLPEFGGVHRSIGVALWLPDLAERQDRPPPPPLKGTTLVRDDREVPRPKPAALASEIRDLAPGLEGRLLDRIFGSLPLAQDRVGQPVSGFDQGGDMTVEACAVDGPYRLI
jgi:hypothetical protein